MTARLDFAQLQLHFVDQMQWRYELIRPLVLLAEGTPTRRAVETHTHPDTVRTFTRRFRPGHARPVAQRYRSAPTRAGAARARGRAPRGGSPALYAGFHYHELAPDLVLHVCATHPSQYRETVVGQSPVVASSSRPVGLSRRNQTGIKARLQVIKLYYQGWDKVSISQFYGCHARLWIGGSRVVRPNICRAHGPQTGPRGPAEAVVSRHG